MKKIGKLHKGESIMKSETQLEKNLKGNFTIVNLGCNRDRDYNLPTRFLKTLTVVEADPEVASNMTGGYYRRITIKKPVADRIGKRSFRRNAFDGTSSLLNPLSGVVEAFGMEDYCREVARYDVDCTTVPQVLAENNLPTLDLLKTDIEGMDDAVIRSCHDYLGKALIIQCELRFRPFYETEPPFEATVNHLRSFNYEVLDILHIDRWKYKTAHRPWQFEGVGHWADFLFVLTPEAIANLPVETRALAVAKQAILLCMIGKKNYAEYLLNKFRASIPSEWLNEIMPLTCGSFPSPATWLPSLRRLFMPFEKFLKHRIGKSEFVAAEWH